MPFVIYEFIVSPVNVLNSLIVKITDPTPSVHALLLFTNNGKVNTGRPH